MNIEIETINPEDSVMGKMQKELETQKEEFRNYATQQEINRDLDQQQAKKNAPKKFLRDCVIAIVSGIIGSIATTIYNDSGFDIISFFQKMMQ